jgi:hypothetical protein
MSHQLYEFFKKEKLRDGEEKNGKKKKESE